MDAAPPHSPEFLHSPPDDATAATVDSDAMTGIQALSKATRKSITIKVKKHKKKKISVDSSDAASSSTSSVCSIHRGIRLRNPRAARQKEGDVEALALPLGMSLAAVVALVLERKSATGETISVDQLAEICALAARESLANVFGDQFDSFVKNFEKSFRSTLMTLRLINESSQCKGEPPRHLKKGSKYLDVIPAMSLNAERCFACSSGVNACQAGVVQPIICSSGDHFDRLEETEQSTLTDSINQELALHGGEINQQLASAINQSMFLEKFVTEQTRSNDLKAFGIGLKIKKLRLKEEQLALHSDLTFLERCKLSMGIKKASFKAEKFKNDLEETRHAELLKKCRDCLVAGLLIMLASIAYGAYVYSHNRITEATASCTPSEMSKSWWFPKPVASFNSGLQILWCQVQVISRMLFGLLMIVVITYLLFQRSATSTQTMPVTLLLLLGVACGFAGKLCIDTLGGSGYHWFLYWEVLCSLHFFASVCTSALFLILHGPITVSQGGGSNTNFPYWIRRVLFYGIVLLFLPMMCGLVPFASPGDWKDHFSLLVMEFLQTTSD